MNDRVIFTLNDHAGPLLDALLVGVDYGILPNLPFDRPFVPEVLKGYLEERLTNQLNVQLHRPPINRVDETVKTFVHYTTAHMQVSTGQYDHYAQRSLLEDCIRRYIREDEPLAAARALVRQGSDPDMGLTLLRQLSGLEVNFVNPDKSEEEYVEHVMGLVDRVICFIEDLDVTFRYKELLDKSLSENPYETCSMQVIGSMAVVTRQGDFRILEWERMNNR